jgi:hypothetical protein
MSIWKTLFGRTSDIGPAAPPPPAMPASNTLTCTLKIWESGKIIPAPTETDIRAAVMALDDSEMGPRLRLSMDGDTNRMELSGTPGDFGFDYHEEAVQAEGYFYASRRTDYSTETAIKVLVAYRNGTPDWQTMVEWKKLKM